MQVHIETLKHVGQEAYAHVTIQRYTVEVTIGKDRRAVRCHPVRVNGEIDHLNLFDLAVRFSSGAKVWPGSAVWWSKTGNVNNLRPNIDKRGYFSLVGYFADFEAKPVASQHNAVA